MGRKSNKKVSDVEQKLRSNRTLALDESLLQHRLQRLELEANVAPKLNDELQQLREQLETIAQARLEVLSMLSKLPAAERRLMTAYYVEGLPWEMAAEYYPCSPRWVYANKERILKDLERIMRKEG